MPRFSQKSQERLASCDPNLQKLFNEAIKYFNCIILEGHRSNERQTLLLSQGKTKTAQSKHLSDPSRAVDAAPYPYNDKDIRRHYFFGGFISGLAKTMGIKIRWGGDWDQDTEVNDQTFNDLVHFELVEEET